MTNEEIRRIQALSPREAAAIIMERFYFKRRFYRRVRGDAYFFLVDPTFHIPEAVLETMSRVTAEAVVDKTLRDDVLVDFGRAEVEMTDWGVKNFGINAMFLHLFVEPGYLDRAGRVRPGVDPDDIPKLLVTLMHVKERLADEVRRFAAAVARPSWWRNMGFLSDPRKQDWSPRED